MRTRTQKGFTIVELLVVIVVIGILASITVVSYTGVQRSARNVARINEVRQWQTLLDLYRAYNGSYPPAIVVGNNYCLGANFPDIDSDGVGDCWDIHTPRGSKAVESTTLSEQLATVGTIAKSTHTPVAGDNSTSRLGPVIYKTLSDGTYVYMLIYWLEGTEDCPVGVNYWNDSRSRSCRIILPD